VTVTIHSEVFGKQPGETYTGAMEAWLLAEGYASEVDYEGPGVDNTGATSVAPANDPRNPANREAPYFPSTTDRHTTIANDATHLTQTKLPNPEFDLDDAGVDTEAPSDLVLDPAEGPAAGGTVVTITGNNLEGVTAVTFDTVAGTALDVSQAGEGIIKVTTPAGTAGPADVLLDDGSTDTTLTGGFTYTA
jgi:hypothetical protein